MNIPSLEGKAAIVTGTATEMVDALAPPLGS